jgi:hypothetical protein
MKYLLIASSILILAAGCNKTEMAQQDVPAPVIPDVVSRSDWKVYQNDKYKFSIEYPNRIDEQKLSPSENANGLTITFGLGPETGVTVSVNKDPGSLGSRVDCQPVTFGGFWANSAKA